MVSAFHAPLVRQNIDDVQRRPSPASTLKQDELKPPAQGSNCESETEDDEVKVHCAGGVQPYMTTDDEEGFDDDGESCCSDASGDGL